MGAQQTGYFKFTHSTDGEAKAQGAHMANKQNANPDLTPKLFAAVPPALTQVDYS